MMELKMRRGIGLGLPAVLLLLSSLSAGVRAQAQGSAAGQNDNANQTKKEKSAQQQAPAAAQPPADANPFPGDVTNVPVMPTTVTPDVPPASPDSAVDKMVAPFSDLDPVKSPDASDGAADTPADIVQGRESSSDNKSMDSLLPTPGDEEPAGKGKRKGSDTLAEPPKETSKEDISVGQYYLDNKNWRAARSRFQSAMVLAPDEPGDLLGTGRGGSASRQLCRSQGKLPEGRRLRSGQQARQGCEEGVERSGDCERRRGEVEGLARSLPNAHKR